MHTFCGQNSELLNVEVGGMYIYHCALMDKKHFDIILPFMSWSPKVFFPSGFPAGNVNCCLLPTRQ
jgi:hypothetical protein